MRDPKFNQLTYDAASFTVANGQTNRDIRDSESALFDKVPEAHKMIISTDQTVTLRLNDTSYGAIVMTSTESPKVFDSVNIANIYVTNAS
jgi:predicted HAD superfamily phosphohydrolase